MEENKNKIGRKYTRKNSSDNNIYKIENVVPENGQQYFIFGPGLKKNDLTKKSEKIQCLCADLDKEFVEQPNL